MAKFADTTKKIEDTVVGAYKTIEDTVVGGYKKVEDTVVGDFQKISDKFVDKFLAREGETVEEAKERLEKEKRKIRRKQYCIN